MMLKQMFLFRKGLFVATNTLFIIIPSAARVFRSCVSDATPRDL